MIEAAFKEQRNMTVTVDPEDLHPATGAWRTNWMLDVYRWEGTGRWTDFGHKGHDGNGLPISIDSWEPMTALVKCGGVKISQQYATAFEIWQRDSNPPPPRQ